MRALDAAGAREVVGLLEERVGAGWRPAEIRRVMDQRLPERYGRLAALVAYRLRANVDPGLAPAVVVAAGEEARAQAARERAERVAVQPAGRPRDPLFERALRQVRRESPRMSMLEAARAAGELVQRWRAEGVGGSDLEGVA